VRSSHTTFNQSKKMKTITQRESRPETNHTRAEEHVVPEVNIFETTDGYVLEAEMPGVSKDGLGITVQGNEITLTGRRNVEPACGEPLFRERRPGEFHRVFELDPAIDTGRISAKMDQGVLTLTLPKAERVKSRTITVD